MSEKQKFHTTTHGYQFGTVKIGFLEIKIRKITSHTAASVAK